ncbi:MAG: N-acetylmuramoyl-L-alanine amidase [Clostridia bacterium]|nr:N-acetylmuramoyl-L-alanine amidase [Clostridia bacterium]
MKKIGLDAGHGLYTAGKQTPDGIKEWSLNDDVCDRIAAILSKYDCEIIRTDNNEGNIDESLSSRVNAYIKAGVDTFVSIHHNAFTGNWNNATGVEVYTDRTPTEKDERLASLIYDRLVQYTGLKGRGIKRANFAVINQNKVPAVLCEGGFMDGSSDYKIITSEAGKQGYARAVAEGLIEFLSLKEKPQTPDVPLPQNPDVIYQVWENVKDKWLPNVVNDTDYAGNFKNAVCAVYANLTSGNIYYKVHVPSSKGKPARWLPEVKNREDYAGNLGQPIDAVMFRTDTDKTICYAAHEKKSGRWLPPVTGYSEADRINGYAGNFGREIDAIKIYFV